MQPALSFQSTTFDVIDKNGQPWLPMEQIGVALGYGIRGNQIDSTFATKAIRNLYTRHADEFTEAMSQVIEISETPTLGGVLITKTRIFSLRGCHALAMFARTPVAKDFRKWVLDILEREAQQQQPQAAIADDEPLETPPGAIIWSDVVDYLEEFPPTSDDVTACQERSPFRTHGTNVRTCFFFDSFKEWLTRRRPFVAEWTDSYLARILRQFGCGYIRYNVKLPDTEGKQTSRGVYVIPKGGPLAFVLPKPEPKPEPMKQLPTPTKSAKRGKGTSLGSMTRTLERVRDDLALLEAAVGNADIGDATLENAIQMALLRNVNRIERLIG